MDGQHTFELDCHYLYRDSRAMGMKIVVDYDVEIEWSFESHSVDMGKVTPNTVVLVVGGFEMPMVDYSDLHGSLAAFVEIESAKLGLEGLGITDEDAKELLRDVEEDRQHRLDLERMPR
ncbi:MAG: hypothetical protein M3Y08_01200 [Fibrobacterota bacterium]|nr:hypothetical protein [Fibrobacterota bacterium]